MSAETPLDISWKPAGRNGTVTLIAKVGDQAIHSDKIDVAAAGERERFILELCRLAAALDPEDVRSTLLDIARRLHESPGDRRSGADEDESPVGERWPEPPDDVAHHGLAGDLVRAIAPHTEADAVALLIQILVIFGNMIGRSAHFVAEGARHTGNLFAVLAGLTSKGRKGSSWQQVHRVMESVDEGWAKSRIHSGMSSGEGLIWAVRDPIEKEEPIWDGKGKDKHIDHYERVQVDAGVADKRLLAMESEFALVLKNLARDGNILSAVIRWCWDSGNLATLTKNNPARATGAHVSIIGHVTRDEVRRYLTATEMANGFGNRFLWLCVRRSQSLPFGGRIGTVNFTDLVNRMREAAESAKKRGEMRRDAAADDLWGEAYDCLSGGRPGLLGAILGRAEAQVMRLAMLYALLDDSGSIGEDHLLAAMALWRYAERSARYIFGASLGADDLDTLLTALATAPDGLTRAEISAEVFRRNKSSARIREILSSLQEYGLAHSRRDATGAPGRPNDGSRRGG